MKSLLAWSGAFLAPLAWFAGMQANFALATLACSTGTKVLLHLVSAATLVLSGGAAALSWRQWRASASGEPQVPPVRGEIALASFVVGIGTSLVVVAQAIPNLLLRACE